MIRPPQGLTETDFDLIQAAVMETERGRWFLAESSRRWRAEDTDRIMATLEDMQARAAEHERERAKAKTETDGTADAMRRLLAILSDLQPLADARVRVPPVPALTEPLPESQTALERRFAALVHLDKMGVEQKLNLFG